MKKYPLVGGRASPCPRFPAYSRPVTPSALSPPYPPTYSPSPTSASHKSADIKGKDADDNDEPQAATRTPNPFISSVRGSLRDHAPLLVKKRLVSWFTFSPAPHYKINRYKYKCQSKPTSQDVPVAMIVRMKIC